MPAKILLTPRSVTRQGHPSLAKLEEAGFELVLARPGETPQEDDLIGLLPGCVGWIAGVETVSARVLESAPDLRVISRNGTGADTINLAAAERLGIKVLRAGGANARGVAELTMALMLALARSIPATDRSLKAGRWERHHGFELEGKTLGLIGCGTIGRLVTGFASALGMRVLAYDPVPGWADAPAGFQYAGLADVFCESDLLSLHCPPPPGRKALLDAAGLSSLKKGVRLINTARAGLIDADALLAALASGHVAGVGLDVFEEEPPTDRRLLEHPLVIATPHIGAFTPESVDRAMTIAVDNLLEALG
jgi:phosphoglycerate dehydrogenase-like enzyme